MKITIDLDENEVNTFKAYLKSVSSELNAKITKDDIKAEIVDMVKGGMQFNAIGEYYKQFCINK